MNKERLELGQDAAEPLFHSRTLDELSLQQLQQLITEHPKISEFQPDGNFQIDPRNGERVLYNAKRAKRPHDNAPTASAAAPSTCVICEGLSTPIIDSADLSEGFTFINENLFPMLFPGSDTPQVTGVDQEPSAKGGAAWGFHLLQWTSSIHGQDWENMSLSDLSIVLARLAALEKKLLVEGAELSGSTNHEWEEDSEKYGYVSVIKNFGRAVGGSLDHGHQQIAYSNMMPRKFRDNLLFERRNGRGFSSFLLEENPKAFTVSDFGEAQLVVPYFMLRPADMILLLKDTKKRYLHQLNSTELAALAKGWKTATQLMLQILAATGRDPAYNVLLHTGPGAGLYLEFLPYTQESGGYERFGLYVTQSNPSLAAEQLKQLHAAIED